MDPPSVDGKKRKEHVDGPAVEAVSHEEKKRQRHAKKTDTDKDSKESRGSRTKTDEGNPQPRKKKAGSVVPGGSPKLNCILSAIQNEILQTPKKSPRQKKAAKKDKRKTREKMKEGEMVRSESYTWKVSKLLGSGGFGDVYKVKKERNDDKKEYAMKTELVVGDKRMLRLKIEVSVLKMCHEVENKQSKRHFVEFVDRGITEKFKFLVMGLVGPSLEDIRKAYLLKNYSKHTAMQAALQTLQSIKDLHELGWLHRDIKPANFAVGLGDHEDIVYMLDFGIARRMYKPDSKEIKEPRTQVKFLGTTRFASRSCHWGLEQGRKDDIETWIFMYQDLFDEEHGLPWKRIGDKTHVILSKEKFMKNGYPKAYKVVPKDFQMIVQYVDHLEYADEPNYSFIRSTMLSIAKDHHISLDKKLDWMGKLKKKQEFKRPEFSSTSSDNHRSGSDESDSSESAKKAKKKRSNKNTGGHKQAKGKKKLTGDH